MIRFRFWIGAAGRRTGWESDMSWTLLLVLITSWGVSMNADLRFATEDQCRAAAQKIAQDIGAQGSQLRPHWSCVLQRRD